MERPRTVQIAVSVMTVAWFCGSFLGAAHAADWSMLGRDGTRNAVSTELGAPLHWSAGTRDRKTGRFVGESHGIRWSAPLGSATFSSPVVSGGLVCIDPTKRGDVSSELAVGADGQPLPRRRVQAVDPKIGEKAIPNRNSALVWEYVRCGTEFQDQMHRSIGSVVIAKGLVIAADNGGIVHCLDAKTGRRHWSYDTMASAVLASPLIVDDRVYVGTQDGEVIIFRISPDPAVALPKLTGKDESPQAILMDEPCESSPIFADGALYLATRSRLYAIVAAKDPLDRPSDKPMPEPRVRRSRSVFVPTPQDVVDKMLALADVKKSDIVYDLGSGDGRIVITAAKKLGCRAIGFEIDKELVDSSRAKAEASGVQALVTIEAKDLFTADLRDADVIAVFLLPQQLEKLLPKLEKLAPGARIISHQFELPGYSPEKTLKVESTEGGPSHTIYLWTSPLKKEKR